ncbi:MAG: YhbY family RNA-binding protein [Oscillibacter sp.]|nr:YhbY family RNA-binding protein [Oscillibacter sp.]
MTPKERARLRGLANGIDTVLQIGKDGIGDTLIHQADITLEARELIKGRVLDTCMDYTPRSAAEALAAATNSEVVQVIGSKFVLYRKRKDAPPAQERNRPRKAEAFQKNGGRNPRNGDAFAQRKPHNGDAFGQRNPRDSGTRNGNASRKANPRGGATFGQHKPRDSGAHSSRSGGAFGQRNPRDGARPDRKTRK